MWLFAPGSQLSSGFSHSLVVRLWLFFACFCALLRLKLSVKQCGSVITYVQSSVIVGVNLITGDLCKQPLLSLIRLLQLMLVVICVVL